MSRSFKRLLMVAALLAGACATAEDALVDGGVGGTYAASATEPASAPGADVAMTPSLHVAYALEQQREAGPEYAVRTGEVLTADNRAQGMSLVFGPSGVDLTPHRANWSLALAVDASTLDLERPA